MKERSQENIVKVLGLGLDAEDGHVRVTRGPNFDLFFGSESTHEKMQETCMKLNERLKKKGRKLEDLSRDEFLGLVSEVD